MNSLEEILRNLDTKTILNEVEQFRRINFVQNPPFFSSNLFFSTFSLVLFRSLLFGDLFTLYTLNPVSSLPYMCKFDSGGAFLSHLTPPCTFRY